MLVSRLSAIAATTVLGIFTTVVSCSGSHASAADTPPPRAEFLLNSADSTFWVATTSGTLHVRGVPLVLARYGDRFFELYTADEDRSYDDALLVGERLYRRDLLTGDSTMVFSDTTVSHVAAIYARTHPDERPLEPSEEGQENPRTSATAQLDILDVFGPFLSYEYHVDIDLPGRAPWHSTRRGVLDLRTGKQSNPADLFGVARAREVVTHARQAYEVVRDSAVRARRELSREEQKAVDALGRRQFDPLSFVVERVDGQPAITFSIPGAGEGSAGNIVELEPITIDSVAWWPEATQGAATRDSLDNDRWTGRAYSVIARYDSAGQIARLSLADSTKGEWVIGAAMGPLRRVDWLDQPPVSAAERAALQRAFNQAAQYDENARVAVRTRPATVVPAALRRTPPKIRHLRGGRSSMRGILVSSRTSAARHTIH